MPSLFEVGDVVKLTEKYKDGSKRYIIIEVQEPDPKHKWGSNEYYYEKVSIIFNTGFAVE